MNISLINGPNLNLLDKRSSSIYGGKSLKKLEQDALIVAKEFGLDLDFFQSNSEEALINYIHSVLETSSAIVINPGAYTHTSIAIRDALEIFKKPIIEVHLSNIHKRESFRHHSFISPVATAVICGLGEFSYQVAIRAVVNLINGGCRK